MISKKGIPAYITPEEAAQISRKAHTIDDIDTALSIKQAYMQLAAAENSTLTDFDELKALAAVYQGGRMQGMRENELGGEQQSILSPDPMRRQQQHRRRKKKFSV